MKKVLKMASLMSLFFFALVVSVSCLAEDSALSGSEISKEKEGGDALVAKKIYDSIGAKVLDGDHEVSVFSKDLDGLMGQLDVLGGIDQSKDFWNSSALFAEKYSKAFPVGLIREKIVRDIHIGPGCEFSFGRELGEKYAKYLFLSSLFLEKGQILGASSRDKDRVLADKFISQSILIGMEVDFDTAVGRPVRQVINSRGVSSSCRRFVEKNKDISLEPIAAFRKYREIEKRRQVFLKLLDGFVLRQVQGISDEDVRKILDGGRVLNGDLESGYCPSWFRYSHVRSIYSFKGIMSDRKDANGIKASEALLLGLSENNKLPRYASRWAAEALKSNLRAVPKRLWCGSVIHAPNGKLGVDEDGDGKPDHPYDPKDYE